MLLPISTEPQDNEPAPVIAAVTLAATALFNVRAPVSVKASLKDNVAPEAVKVNEAALVALFNVAVPAVFDTVIAPVAVKSQIIVICN